MAAVAFVSVLLILALRGGLGLGWLVAVSLVTALVSALAELCSKGGMDTVICPVGAMAALIGMLYVAGGL